MTFAVLREVLASLAGLGFVAFVTWVFVVLARFFARRLLGDEDGSSVR